MSARGLHMLMGGRFEHWCSPGVHMADKRPEEERYEQMRAAYNSLSEELWRLHDECPQFANRIRVAFSRASRAYNGVKAPRP